jgi:hypothetical protein
METLVPINWEDWTGKKVEACARKRKKIRRRASNVKDSKVAAIGRILVEYKRVGNPKKVTYKSFWATCTRN